MLNVHIERVFSDNIALLIIRKQLLDDGSKETGIATGVFLDGFSEVRIEIGKIIEVDGDIDLLAMS